MNTRAILGAVHLLNGMTISLRHDLTWEASDPEVAQDAECVIAAEDLRESDGIPDVVMLTRLAKAWAGNMERYA